MVKTASTMLELGTSAPEFTLPDTTGASVSLSDYGDAPALVVAFICNHCPFVVHIREALAEFGREYQERGVAIVAINSNDVASHPDDSPEKMAEELASAGYTFAYRTPYPNRWPRPTGLRARRTSSSSTGTSGWPIVASSTRVVRRAESR